MSHFYTFLKVLQQLRCAPLWKIGKEWPKKLGKNGKIILLLHLPSSSVRFPKLKNRNPSLKKIHRYLVIAIFSILRALWKVWKVQVEKRSNSDGGKLSKLIYLAKKVVNCGGNYSDVVDLLLPRSIDEGQPFLIQPGNKIWKKFKNFDIHLFCSILTYYAQYWLIFSILT